MSNNGLISNIYKLLIQLNIKNTNKGQSHDGRAKGWGVHFLPHKYIRRSSSCEAKQTFESWQRTPDTQKVKRISLKWSGTKYNDENRGKGSGKDTHLGEGVMKKEKFPQKRKPCHRWGLGIFRSSEGSIMRKKKNYRILPNSDYQQKSGSYTHVQPQWVGAECGGVGPISKVLSKDQGWMSRTVWGANVT